MHAIERLDEVLRHSQYLVLLLCPEDHMLTARGAFELAVFVRQKRPMAAIAKIYIEPCGKLTSPQALICLLVSLLALIAAWSLWTDHACIGIHDLGGFLLLLLRLTAVGAIVLPSAQGVLTAAGCVAAGVRLLPGLACFRWASCEEDESLPKEALLHAVMRLWSSPSRPDTTVGRVLGLPGPERFEQYVRKRLPIVLFCALLLRALRALTIGIVGSITLALVVTSATWTATSPSAGCGGDSVMWDVAGAMTCIVEPMWSDGSSTLLHLLQPTNGESVSEAAAVCVVKHGFSVAGAPSPLLLAAGLKPEAPSLMSELLARDTNVTVQDSRGRTPLMRAVVNGNLRTTEALASTRISVNMRDHRGWTPLLVASRQHDQDILAVLLDHAADPDLVDRDGRAALHFAAWSGDYGATNSLIQHNATVSLRDSLLHAPIWYATKRCTAGRCSDVAELLRQNGGATDLLDAARVGNVLLVSSFLSAGADPNATDARGRSVLLIAVDSTLAAPSAIEEIVRLLLKTGRCDPNVQEQWTKRTALISAADRCQRGPVRALVGIAITKLDLRDRWGRTALSYAASNGDIETANMLLAGSAKVNACDRSGRTPLWFATHSCKLKAGDRCGPVQAVLESKGSAQSWEEAVLEGRTDLVSQMINSGGFDIDIQNKESRTALMIAAWYGRRDMVKVLLDGGASSVQKDASGRDSVQYAQACAQGECDAVLRLLQRDPKYVLAHGATIFPNPVAASAA